MVLSLRLLKACSRSDSKTPYAAALASFAVATLALLAAILLLQNDLGWGLPTVLILNPGPNLCTCQEAKAELPILESGVGVQTLASEVQKVHPALQPLLESPPWNSSLVIVPAVYHDWDAGWPEWTEEFAVHVYQRTNASAPNYCENRAFESAVYLKFIVDYYHNLPDLTAFVHSDPPSHRRDIFTWLRCLRPNSTYSALNVHWLNHWHVDRPLEILGKSKFPTGACQVPRIEACFRRFAAIFGKDLSAEPGGKVEPSFYASNQFVISRDVILRHPLRVYQEAYKLIGLEDRCVEGPIDPRENWALGKGNYCLQEPPREWLEEGFESKIVQAMTMEYLNHYVFEVEELDGKPYTDEHYCKQFLSSEQCPGSPCEQKARA
ncbi:hypothetical protein KFL_000510140 [Klebsormidium nitens]|uniref:Uncharacterized protein n=1 Tax=Klebsormidium nitens TaxID=105231 RepID=A0A1Y1HQF6_KLENI|nr:hypothetical protein KFL_000510140 [Klebsormidium nitens]|eukprot:GAQ80313.1 hypothetical protein KFL_000510140 [Klebsormidium nitens]